ncbi:secretion protein HlyD [Gemmatimonadetes bacterium T265]|nr:secretion protein HlyD [Gemmatimonadetes bacterium T265]
MTPSTPDGAPDRSSDGAVRDRTLREAAARDAALQHAAHRDGLYDGPHRDANSVFPRDLPPEHPGHPAVEHVAHRADTGAAPPVRPASTRRVLTIAAASGVVLVGLFVAATLPRRAVGREIAADAATADAPPAVAVATVHRAAAPGEFTLPGTIQALHEGVIYARVPGYVRAWRADIGTLVHAGDVLADVDAPELREQVREAQQQVAQSRAALGLARADVARWRDLAADSAVTRQEYDQKQAAYAAAQAGTGAAGANLRRLTEMQQFTRVTAPFTGVVTARNVDIGSLITAAGATSAAVAGGSGDASAAGSSLFRIAQTDTVRTYVPVPEGEATAIRAGQPAELEIQEVPGRRFVGRVVRTSRSLNVASRTLLTEVDVPNPGAVLLPGMYARVHLHLSGGTPPLVIPAAALVVRQGGPQVMVVDAPSGGAESGTAVVHLRPVQVGRDYGATLEILDGVPEGATVVANPSAELGEGSRVRPAAAAGR